MTTTGFVPNLLLYFLLMTKSPFQITDTILSPEVAFTGDTTPDFMLDPRNADALRAKILITEVKQDQFIIYEGLYSVYISSILAKL